ncbi:MULTISPECIES: hypothetical protein [unclassified Streptomyces]|uniref:hypothetical protein n=1 Tax=unclassified Streptomyces TaxID=2593676 RepID=UPI002E308D91|nr:hypothetical protein [Streptomyces sp. NBC_01278]
MSDPQDDTTAVTAEPAAPEPQAPAATPATAPRVRGRRTTALIAGGVGIAVLAGGALWGAGQIAGADRTAPTRYWGAANATPRPTGTSDPRPTVPPNELTGKLLPLPAGFEPGPDLDEDGNDFYVSGELALQSLKEVRSGLSGDQRAERDKALGDLKLKGMAGRSYQQVRENRVVEIHLTQADPQTLAKFSEFSKKLLELTGGDRDAPKIDGFPDAKCALETLGKEKVEEKEKIEAMDCVALQGDVLVAFRTYGRKPFSANDGADLFKRQLNHLKSPGESV